MGPGGGADGDKAAVLELPLPVSNDPPFDLATAVCSHGMFMMAPNLWDPATKSLTRPLRIPSSSSPVNVRISQAPATEAPSLLLVSVLDASAPLSPRDQEALLRQVRRMLRLSEENDRLVREFHAVHADAKRRGFGRIFRSPTLFEDMVKCILLCNCQWSRTLSMARALCDLQLELRSHLNPENFHPKTPEASERKRKGRKGKKTVVKLEIRFPDHGMKLSGDSNSVTNSDSHSIPTREHPCNVSIPSQPINIGSGDSPMRPTEIGAFPIPEELANLDPEFLARRCNLGYRAQRIVLLAKGIMDGTVPLRNLEQACNNGCMPSNYAEMEEQLSGIYGFGPFTRANVLMCMGFYEQVPTDTETMRHLKMVHARHCTTKSVADHVDEIYGKYGQFQFLAYWSELWEYYEQRFGDLKEMPASDYQLITASNMKQVSRKKPKKKI